MPMQHEGSRGALAAVAELASDHIERRRADPVARPVDAEELRRRIASFDFSQPVGAAEVAVSLFDLLRDTGVRSDHPRYFGLFNPPSLVPAIIGDLVANTVNPQLAVWSHAPAAAEIERHLLQVIGSHVWQEGEIAGSFTNGGSEANHTALLCALARRYPEWSDKGLPETAKKPAIYVSEEAHLAWVKIARAAGLGACAVRLVATNDGLRLDADALLKAIEKDVDKIPLLIVATAGTTGHGAIDDLEGLAAVSRKNGAHFHVDAAWAGAILLSPRHRRHLAGIELADSVTIDPHKWLAVPMGAGMYLARDWEPLETAFGVSTGYMPSASRADRDPYIHSLQWSRRFNGAKLFTALATLGLAGYAEIIDRQLELGDRLRQGLSSNGFRIVNDTALPLVCLTPGTGEREATLRIQQDVTASGQAWLSTVSLRGELCLRACITSFETSAADIDVFVAALVKVRDQVQPLPTQVED